MYEYYIKKTVICSTLYTMFPVEHNLCSIHTLVCGSALPLPSLTRDGHLFFLPKSLISLSSSLSHPIGIETRCGTLVSGSALPLPSLMRDGHLLFFLFCQKSLISLLSLSSFIESQWTDTTIQVGT